MLSGENISWIKGTPMGIDIRRLSFIAPHRHENLIEITMCLTGEIKFSYCFEEFNLKPGDFILVDKDVHYLHGGEAVCVSFYIDLNHFKKKYPYIDSLMFVCEGTPESNVPHNTYYHKYLKSILLALLLYISAHSEEAQTEITRKKILTTTEKIISLMMDHFDIIFFYNPASNLKPEVMERYRRIIKYIHDHCWEKVTIEELAEECGLSKTYLSEFMSTITPGFRAMTGYIRAYKSEKYLMDTDMSVVEISEACGFSDIKYYYDAFKTWYHCTPGQFRKKYRNEMGQGNVEAMLPAKAIAKPLGKMMKDHFVDMFL